MRHLMNPLDLTVEESTVFLILRMTLKRTLPSIHINVMALKLLLYFMNQVHEHDSVLKLL